MKKIIVLLLVVLTVLFISCSKEPPVPTGEVTPPETTQEPTAEPTTEEPKADYDPVPGDNPWKPGMKMGKLPIYSGHFSKDGTRADHWLNFDEMERLVKDIATKHDLEILSLEEFTDPNGMVSRIGVINRGQIRVQSDGKYSLSFEGLLKDDAERIAAQLKDPLKHFPEFFNMEKPLIPEGNFKWIYGQSGTREQDFVNYHFWHTIVNIDEQNNLYSIENERKDLRNPLGEVQIITEEEAFRLAADQKLPTFGEVFTEAYDQVQLTYILDEKLWVPMYDFQLGEQSFRVYAFTENIDDFLKFTRNEPGNPSYDQAFTELPIYKNLAIVSNDGWHGGYTEDQLIERAQEVLTKLGWTAQGASEVEHSERAEKWFENENTDSNVSTVLQRTDKGGLWFNPDGKILVEFTKPVDLGAQKPLDYVREHLWPIIDYSKPVEADGFMIYEDGTNPTERLDNYHFNNTMAFVDESNQLYMVSIVPPHMFEYVDTVPILSIEQATEKLNRGEVMYDEYDLSQGEAFKVSRIHHVRLEYDRTRNGRYALPYYVFTVSLTYDDPQQEQYNESYLHPLEFRVNALSDETMQRFKDNKQPLQ